MCPGSVCQMDTHGVSSIVFGFSEGDKSHPVRMHQSLNIGLKPSVQDFSEALQVLSNEIGYKCVQWLLSLPSLCMTTIVVFSE